MAQDQQYDEVIETSGVKNPLIARITTPKIERPMRNNRYESGECKTLRALLRPGDRVLELGAGIGLISSVAAKVEGIQAVTAIEANPELIPVIEETYRLNGIAGVDLRNGVDVRGTYDLAVLDHFPLRSLHSYLVKMSRGDVVVKHKMVSQRYWCQWDRQSDLTSTFERQRQGFQKVYNALMQDKTLGKIHS